MTNEEMMLNAVVADPDDDTARLVYADAVQERDEVLAALIRTGVLCHCVTERYCGVPFAGLIGDRYQCPSCSGKLFRPRCEHEGCRAAGDECYLPADDESEVDRPDGFYCGEHAPGHGFCARCGTFSAGIESFDFDRGGLCGGCRDDVDAEDEAEFDDDFGDDVGYGGEFYPDEF